VLRITGRTHCPSRGVVYGAAVDGEGARAKRSGAVDVQLASQVRYAATESAAAAAQGQGAGARLGKADRASADGAGDLQSSAVDGEVADHEAVAKRSAAVDVQLAGRERYATTETEVGTAERPCARADFGDGGAAAAAVHQCAADFAGAGGRALQSQGLGAQAG